TLVSLYQGSATGNPVRHYTTDYSAFADGLPLGSDFAGYLPVRITTTLEDGRVAKKEFDHDTFTYTYTYCSNMTLCLQHGQGDTRTLHASRGNVKEVREFDYGSGTPGPLLRRTKKTYLHDSNANYLTYNVVNKVLADTVCNGVVACAGTGDQSALTQY